MLVQKLIVIGVRSTKDQQSTLCQTLDVSSYNDCITGESVQSIHIISRALTVVTFTRCFSANGVVQVNY